MGSLLIAGLGSIGKRHLRNLVSLNKTDILLLRTHPDPIDEAPDLPVYTDLADALRRKPEWALICTPTAYHLPIAEACARAGCHLFIEKPLSHSWTGMDEFLALIAQHNVKTCVGFDLRFDLGLCKVKELLEEGRIGRVMAVQVQVGHHLPDWHPWEDYRTGVSARQDTGGGVILDLIHELDYIRWLNGRIDEVICWAGRVSSLEIETEDMAAMLLRFANGSTGTVHLDYIQRTPSRTCRIIGEEGTILCDLQARTVKWYEAARKDWQHYDYRHSERNDRFLDEMRHLLDCIEGRATPRVTAGEAARVLQIALAAKRSAVERCWVKL